MGKGIFFIVIVLSLVISGCVSEQPSQVTPTPTRAQPTEIPTTEITPVVTPAITSAVTPAATPGTSVEILNASVITGRSFEVIWRVNSPTTVSITHTAVHYGPESKSEPLTLQSYPSLTTPQGGTVPAVFNATVTVNKTGTTYFRTHAIVSGTNYWSSEMIFVTNNVSANISSASATPTIRITPTVSAGTPTATPTSLMGTPTATPTSTVSAGTPTSSGGSY